MMTSTMKTSGSKKPKWPRITFETNARYKPVDAYLTISLVQNRRPSKSGSTFQVTYCHQIAPMMVRASYVHRWCRARRAGKRR
jgi:hypothetical protein